MSIYKEKIVLSLSEFEEDDWVLSHVNGKYYSLILAKDSMKSKGLDFNPADFNLKQGLVGWLSKEGLLDRYKSFSITIRPFGKKECAVDE